MECTDGLRWTGLQMGRHPDPGSGRHLLRVAGANWSAPEDDAGRRWDESEKVGPSEARRAQAVGSEAGMVESSEAAGHRSRKSN